MVGMKRHRQQTLLGGESLHACTRRRCRIVVHGVGLRKHLVGDVEVGRLDEHTVSRLVYHAVASDHEQTTTARLRDQFNRTGRAIDGEF